MIEWVTDAEPAFDLLVHKVRIDRALRGRAVLETEDPLVSDYADWAEDPDNGLTGYYGLVNVETVADRGIYYWIGLSDAASAAKFQARWGDIPQPDYHGAAAA